MSFSASDAALAGFQLIREQWRLVAGWALFNLLALVAATVVAFVFTGAIVVLSGSSEAAGLVAVVVLALGAFAVEVMIVAALFRAMLRSGPPGFLHLRLGPDEFRIALVWFVMLVGVTVVLGVAIPIAVTVGGWRGFGLALLGLAGAIWLALKFALAAPVAVAEHRIGFARSWRLTRGRMIPLLGMCALAACLVAMVAIVGWLTLVMAVGAVTGFDQLGLLNLSDAEAYAERPVLYMTQLVAQFLFAPILWALSQAPLVAAYRAFTAEG